MDERAPWSLRRAGTEDAGALALVGAATFLETYAGLLPGTDIVSHCAERHAPASYEPWLRDAASACWLIDGPTGAPLGYAVATAPDLPLVDLARGDVELRRIYILGLLRGEGGGRALVEAALTWAGERGAPRLLLGVYDRNERALGFYRRMGFRTVGERTFQVGAGSYHDWVLARDCPA